MHNGIVFNSDEGEIESRKGEGDLRIPSCENYILTWAQLCGHERLICRRGLIPILIGGGWKPSTCLISDLRYK